MYAPLLGKLFESFTITLRNVKMLGMNLAPHKTPEDTALANIMC